MPDLLAPETDYYKDISPTAILLKDGVYFDIFDPRTWVFNVETIAFSLANQTRFRGHTYFYSIAEHSVRVSKWLEERGYSHRIQYMGLHHDDVEYVLGDAPSPHKKSMTMGGESFHELEATIEYAYFATLGILTPAFDEEWAYVKEADLAIYFTERDERPYCGRGLTPTVARFEYMERHNDLAWRFDDVPRIS